MTTLAIGPHIYKTLPYDTEKDFAPVGLVGSAQFALVANPSLGAKTLPELIALVKSKNGQMSYGTSGASTPHHLFMEMFLKMIDAKAQHVPYRGSVPALTDVISGQIPFMMIDLAVAMGADPRRQGDRLRRHLADPRQGHARAADHRRGGLAGLRGARLVLGGGARRHAAADHRQAQRRADALSQAADVQDRLNALAIEPRTSTPDEMERVPRHGDRQMGARWSRTPASSRSDRRDRRGKLSSIELRDFRLSR